MKTTSRISAALLCLSVAASCAGAVTPPARELTQASGIDLVNVVETVRHHIAATADDASLLAVDSRLYRAQFDADGFSLTLRADGRASSVREAFAVAVDGVEAGEQSLPLSPGAWRSHNNRATRDLLPGLAERVTAREGHIEWDFLLAQAPAGDSPLRITATIDAPQSTAAVADGATLVWDGASGRRVRMGELVVLDAGGHEIYRAAPHATDTRVSLTVPTQVLARADYPLTLDPVISPEYPVSDPVYQSVAPGLSAEPDIAFNRDAGFDASFLVVWSDRRFESLEYDIIAARVSPDGTLLDPSGIVVSSAAGDQRAPQVASSGFSFLIVWMDERSGTDWDIYGARVSPNGFLLDGPPDSGGIAISTAADDQTGPAITFNSGASSAGYQVVWSDRRNGVDDDLYATRLNNAGTVFGVNGTPIATGSGNQTGAVIASRGDESLVVWIDTSGADYDLYAARVSAEGALLATGIAISTAVGHQFEPSIAVQSGASPYFLVVWTDQRAGGVERQIYGARVGPFGILVDTPPGTGGLPIAISPGTKYTPDVAWGSSDFMVIWEHRQSGTSNRGDVYGNRMSAGGTLLDGPAAGGGVAFTSGDRVRTPAIGSDPFNDRYLMSWINTANYPDTVHGARVSHAGALLDGVPGDGGVRISLGANEQDLPRVATDGNNYLVVWEDHRHESNTDIYAARITASGANLDGSGIPVATTQEQEVRPVVSWNGSNYLIVWSQTDPVGFLDIHATRMTADGVLLDGAADAGGIVVASSDLRESRPEVAWNGSKHLVVWEAYDVSGTIFPDYSDTDVGGRFVFADGTLANLPFPGSPLILRSSMTEWHPTVASDGVDFMLAWDECTHDSDDFFRDCTSFSPHIVYAKRVSQAGYPAGDRTLVAQYSLYPDLAWGDGNYLLTWFRDWPSLAPDIYAARLAADGTLLDDPGPGLGGFAVSSAPDWQSQATVAWNGASFVVVWSDWRAGGDAELYMARVTAAGDLLDGPPDTGGVIVSGGPHGNGGPDIATTSGKAAVSYLRATDEQAYTGVDRVFLRTLDFAADTSIEKYGLPYTAAVGGEITYTLTVFNDGPNAATNVTVTDDLPAGVSFVSASPEQGSCAEAGGVVTCELGDRDVGGFTQIDIVVTTSQTGTLTNTAQVHSNEPDPDTTDNTVTYANVVVDGADMGLSISDAEDPVLVGATVVYTVAVTNHGPSPATAIEVFNSPQGALTGYATTSGVCFVLFPPFLNCYLDDMAPGASATITLEVTAAVPGTLENFSRVSAFEPDPNASNDEWTEETSVYDPSWADLAVTKTANPEQVVVGETIRYAIVVSNNGPATATNVSLFDTLGPNVAPFGVNTSQGLCFVDVVELTVTCSLDSLASGASASVDLDVAAVAPGPAPNSVTVTASQTDPASANNAATALSTVHPGDDADADGMWDYQDNCILQPNGPLIPDAGGNIQRDTDGDGYGNVCDPDVNQDLVVNVVDLGVLRVNFFQGGDLDTDFNGDGVTNAIDLGIMKAWFFAAPGPSGLAP